MGIKINKFRAKESLNKAYSIAMSDARLPEDWEHLARFLREPNASRTYTAALVTSLLARACTNAADPLSIKETYSDRSFSLRTLCHDVLVPASVELSLDLGATGREPLNNQPFFRYEHYDQIDRIQNRARPYFNHLRNRLVTLEKYSEEQALESLSAVLRVCAEYARKKQRSVAGSTVVESSLILHTQRFVTSGDDVPKKMQACVAAGLDMGYEKVGSRRLNDPSRDIPGDVHVFAGDFPSLAVEVRGKLVTENEFEQFVRSVCEAEIPRASLVVDSSSHVSLPVDELTLRLEDKYDCLVKINESVSSFLRDVFAWSTQDVHRILGKFPECVFQRMLEIEVRQTELDAWVNQFPSED